MLDHIICSTLITCAFVMSGLFFSALYQYYGATYAWGILAACTSIGVGVGVLSWLHTETNFWEE